MSESEPSRSASPRGSRNTRLVMLSAAIGALLILLLSVLLNWPISGNAGRTGALSAPQEFRSAPGTCLNWEKQNAADVNQVGCERPHLFEATGTADLGARFSEDAAYPGPREWQQLKQDRCVDVSRDYLRGQLDPSGRFSVGAFTPSKDSWEDGDRTLHCGVQQPGPSGALYRVAGRAAEVDQANTHDAGRCLGINGKSVWDPVECSQQHAVEITGTVQVDEKFAADYPATSDQDQFLATRCRDLTSEYAGGANAARDKGLVTYWDTLSEESWNAGSRQVNCKVSAQLPDGSGLAPVTGSVRGEVQVHDTPAPQDPNAGRPGVPAGRAW